MATKAEERKALEQIRKIVSGLGEDSYIGWAFEGCFEIAQENIENDWACSMKQKVDAMEVACDLRMGQADKLQEKLDATEAELKLAKYTMLQEGERANDLADRLKETEKTGSENLQKLLEYQSKAAAQEMEIMKLKAKLYDLMMA